MRTFILALALAMGAGVSLYATTIVVFRANGAVILATDSAAVGLDEKTRTTTDGVRVGCKIQKSGRFWSVQGGFLLTRTTDLREVIAHRIADAHSMAEALAAVDDEYRKHLHALITAEPALFRNRQVGTPVMAVILADSTDLSLGIFRVTVKQQDPFDVVATSEIPSGSYYTIASQPSPVIDQFLRNPAPWFQMGDAAAAKRFIEMQISETPMLAARPIDVLEIRADRARWFDRDVQSTCAAVP